MRALAAAPSGSQRELALTTGLSLGKTNYCLRALIAQGFVKVARFRKSSNKLAYLYLLTPSGVAAKARLTRWFLARKVCEYEALQREIEMLRRETEAAAGEFARALQTEPSGGGGGSRSGLSRRSGHARRRL